MGNLAAGQLRLIVASYTIDDGNSGTVAQTVTITISGTNDVPTVASALTLARNEGQVYTDGTNTVNLLAGASDVDTNDVLSAVTLTYRVDSTPTGVSGTQLPAGVSLSGSPSK